MRIPGAIIDTPIFPPFIQPGIIQSHIHAAIPEGQLHGLALKSPSLRFIFLLLFDTTPRSLSRRTPGQGSQSACLQLTGIIGIPPPPGSPGAALIAWSPAIQTKKSPHDVTATKGDASVLIQFSAEKQYLL